MVKHKSKYSCESATYFNQSSEIINKNCNFYFNNANFKPAVFDGGNDKHIECNINNDIPVRITSFPYVLLNWSV